MVYLYVTARKLDILDASARGFKLMVLNFESLISTKEFLDLEIEQVLEIFNADEIGARSEVIIFIAALKWLDYDYLEREEYVKQIFECVRFPLMSREEILACYHPCLLPGLMVMPEIRKSLLNATCYITAKSLGQESLFSELACKPRSFLFAGEPMILWDLSIFDPDQYEITKKQNAAIKIQACYRGYITRKKLEEEIFIANYAATIIQSVYRGYRIRKSIQLTKRKMKKKGKCVKNYLLHSDKRTGLLKAYSKRTFEVFQLDTQSKEHAVIYAMRSFDEQTKEGNTLFAIDTRDENCKVLGKCLTPHYDSRMIYHDGHLYILGGFNPLIRTQSGEMLPSKQVYRYYVATGEWRTMPEMNEARCYHAAAVLNEEILAIGGKNEENRNIFVDEADMEDRDVLEIDRILRDTQPKCFESSFELYNYEYSRTLSSIERYDMTVGRWKDFSLPLPEPRMAIGCTIHRGSLWIAGGITCKDNKIYVMDSILCLDNKTCRWAEKVNLPQPLAWPTLMSDGNGLFCIGGMAPMHGGELESTNKVYKYDVGEWVEHSTLPFEAHSIVGSKIGNSLYILGGFSSETMSPVQDKVQIHLDEAKIDNLNEGLLKEAGLIVEATESWK